MYSILFFDTAYDTPSVSDFTSLEDAQKEADILSQKFPDARIEIHDDEGPLLK